jgi:hypothetical protein
MKNMAEKGELVVKKLDFMV